MKRKRKPEVKFFINPSYTYPDHELNVLKECLSAWHDNAHEGLPPYFNEFEFRLTHKKKDGKEIHVYECNATWNWISKTKLYDSLSPLIENFGEVLNK